MSSNPLKIEFINYYQSGYHRQIVDWLHENNIAYQLDWINDTNVDLNDRLDRRSLWFPRPYLSFGNAKDAMLFKLVWHRGG